MTPTSSAADCPSPPLLSQGERHDRHRPWQERVWAAKADVDCFTYRWNQGVSVGFWLLINSYMPSEELFFLDRISTLSRRDMGRLHEQHSAQVRLEGRQATTSSARTSNPPRLLRHGRRWPAGQRPSILLFQVPVSSLFLKNCSARSSLGGVCNRQESRLPLCRFLIEAEVQVI